MKLSLVSDTHNEVWGKAWKLKDLPKTIVNKFELLPWQEKLLDADDDVTILAGDIDSHFPRLCNFLCLLAQKKKIVIFVDGNHEHWGYHYDDIKAILSEINKDFPNFFYLDNQTLDIDGVTFYGGCMWTEFEKNPLTMMAAVHGIKDFKLIKGLEGIPGATRVLDEHIAFRQNAPEKIDVCVTHFSPTFRGILPVFRGDNLNGYFNNDMENFMHEKRVKLWLHGHLHNELDYMVVRGRGPLRTSCRVICHPYGYPRENVGAKPFYSYEPKIIQFPI